MKLLMISGKGAVETAQGKRNAFYNTLEELHQYFERIDVICGASGELFGNVFFHEQYTGQQANVMTVHEYAPFRNGRLANRIWAKTKVPMLFEIMHIPGVPRAGDWKEYIAKFMTAYYITYDVRHATAVRVINSQVKAWLMQRGIPESKITLVPAFYIDLDIFKPMPVKKKYDMIYVGRRARNKGIELFEKAGRGFKICIVDGWAKDSAEIARLLNESRMLIMPSYNEGGPRVVLEALACGIPVLATPVGIVPEVVQPEYVIDWSVDDIVRKAIKILEHPPHFDLRIIAERFEKRKMIKQYAELLCQLIHRRTL